MLHQNLPIAIGCDHSGISLKSEIITFFKENQIDFIDCGCFDKQSVDYPDIAKLVCDKIKLKQVDKGVLICGTGIGISMSANKINGIRAALCHDEFSAKYTRLHNNSNVLCLGARVIGSGIATEILQTFLSYNFEGGRHSKRVDKLMSLENK